MAQPQKSTPFLWFNDQEAASRLARSNSGLLSETESRDSRTSAPARISGADAERAA